MEIYSKSNPSKKTFNSEFLNIDANKSAILKQDFCVSLIAAYLNYPGSSIKPMLTNKQKAKKMIIKKNSHILSLKTKQKKIY